MACLVRTPLLRCLCAALFVFLVPALGQAQTTPRRMQRTASSRLKNPPEVVSTPPTVDPSQSTNTAQPIYEFESSPVDGSGDEYIESGDGGQIYDDGSFVNGGFDDEMYWGDGGYRRYGCPGIFCHPLCCQQLYLRADYLLWWGRGFSAPPLVTTSLPNTSSTDAGVLGLSSTSVLFPNGTLAGASQSGGRARIGYWFDPCDTAAVEGTYFAIGQANSSFSASNSDYPILARPFVNVTTGSVGNAAQLIAYPNLYSGSIAVRGTSTLQGAEVIVRHLIGRGNDWRLDWTLGWRYNRLDDNLNITGNRVTLGGETAPVAGATLTQWDRFSTRNTFNGVQLGMISEMRRQRWWFETRASLALGVNRALVDIGGQSTSVTPMGGGSQTVTTPGGLLTQPSNIGQYYNDDFAIVPQIGLNLGFELTSGLWATFGYNFMYWSRVARPGDQIDTDVNLSQSSGGTLVGLPRPAYSGLTTDYWAQGLNFGLAYRY